jgi:hypothetical protein
MISSIFIGAVGVGPFVVWIAIGLAVGFLAYSARTRHDHAHHR